MFYNASYAFVIRDGCIVYSESAERVSASNTVDKVMLGYKSQSQSQMTHFLNTTLGQSITVHHLTDPEVKNNVEILTNIKPLFSAKQK